MPGTTYRIRAYAYKAPGEDPKHLISTEGADSYTDVTLTQDDRPLSASLKVRLADVLFNGMATASGIVVTPGGYYSNHGVNIHLGPVTDFVLPHSPFWAEYSPTPVPGMKLVYETTRTMDGLTIEGTLSYEVLSVSGNAVTYKFEVSEGNLTTNYDIDGDMRRFHSFPESGDSYIRIGEEAVTVPKGTYPDAVKLTQRGYATETTIWMVKGVGRVKQVTKPFVSSNPDDGAVMRLTQLIMP